MSEPIEFVIEDPTAEDLDMPDCSSVMPTSIEGYEPETDPDNAELPENPVSA